MRRLTYSVYIYLCTHTCEYKGPRPLCSLGTPTPAGMEQTTVDHAPLFSMAPSGRRNKKQQQKQTIPRPDARNGRESKKYKYRTCSSWLRLFVCFYGRKKKKRAGARSRVIIPSRTDAARFCSRPYIRSRRRQISPAPLL